MTAVAEPWSVEQMVAMRDGMTISRDSRLGRANTVIWFSLGAGTDISQEAYERWALYLGGSGRVDFLVGEPRDRRGSRPDPEGGGRESRDVSGRPGVETGRAAETAPLMEQLQAKEDPLPAGAAQIRTLLPGTMLLIPGGTLCGAESGGGAVYTEIIMQEDPIIMNEQITPGKVMQLKDLVSYEEGSVVNFSIVSNKSLRFVLMAFDEGTALNPHSAPGNAIVTALEGTGVIGYEGEEFELKEGESFRFAKGGLHSVAALNGRFKMSLVLVLE